MARMLGVRAMVESVEILGTPNFFLKTPWYPRAVAAAPRPSRRPRQLTASLYSSPPNLLPSFGRAVEELEKRLERPVWMCVQGGDGPAATLGPIARSLFLKARNELSAGSSVVLLLESPGGYASDAYAIARILCHHAGGFTAVVPSHAKSAATLLALGAEELLMGIDAEMGPLDAQQWDHEREERTSALNEIQALERLHSVALEQLDRTMKVMMSGAKKRTEIILPIACRFVSDLMKPLLEDIDMVHYAKQTRVLKVAEDYASRLLSTHYGERAAKEISNQLVHGYPEHGFVIGREEMEELMGATLEPPDAIKGIVQKIDEIFESHPPFVAIGRLKEVR